MFLILALAAPSINFGSVHDQEAATLSSSPAGAAQAVQGSPAKFGSVAADSKPKDKTIGFGNVKAGDAPAGSTPAPTRSLDFNKLFQSGGGSTTNTSNSSAASVKSPNGTAATTPATEVTSPTSPSMPRPPRVASGQYGGGSQQPRSPHLGGQAPMQPMPHMNAPHWQQGQMYYSPMYQQYGYAGMPQQMPHHMGQQWGQPQPGFDQRQPRSPRHMPAASLGAVQNGPTPGTPTAGVSSPAAAQRSIASPPAHHIGMGLPQSRPPNFAGGNFGHSPSPSFSGNSMSAAARQFEPSQPIQKRASSAIKIVDPNTNAAVDFKSIPKKDATPGTPKAVPSTPSTPVTSTPVAAAAPVAAASAASASPAPAARTTTTNTANIPSTAPSPAPSANKIETSDDFMKRVKAAAEEAKRQKEEKASAEAAQKAKEEADKKASEEAAAREKEKAERKEAEAKAKAKEAEEQKEREAKEEARKQQEATEAAKKAADEEEARRKAAAESQVKSPVPQLNAQATEDAQEAGKPAPPPIDTAAAAAGGAAGLAATASKDSNATLTPSFRGSAADVERMAREASSVPSTPMEGSAPRLPPTPRTPGTPGFANLPAKPVSSMTASAGNGIKLDSDVLERRRKATPSQLDIAPTQNRSVSGEVPSSAASAASAALGSARFIEDLSKVAYPDTILSPRAELNESAEPRKFRYDRDFLLQFMGVYKERPSELPPLAAIGMDSSQAAPARGTPGRRASQMGPPAAPGRNGSIGLGLGAGFGNTKAGGMGQFSHPAKTSEERFAASNRGSVGAFGSSGPMGSFNASARTQPLSRGGSGSNAIPTREAMGTGIPSGGRTSSRRGKDRNPGRSGVNPPEKGGPTIPMDQVVPLANSENRWTGNRGQTAKLDSPDLVTRKVKALLNKLTLERFDSISSQILEWANKSVEEKDGQTLRIVIALTFEKATDEAAWSEMYATLCRKIMEKLDPNIQDENIKGSDDKPVAGGHLFRKYLVNRCQEDFERGWAARDATAAAAKSKEAEDNAKKQQNEKAAAEAKEAEARGEKPAEPKEAELLSDEYYEAQKAKRRGLGLVRFIGELFKFQMLTEKIMHLCVQKLLSNTTTPEEEEIESLCKLLTTVGKLLEEGKARNYMDVYFKRIDEMMSSGVMTPRMKFMLQDVIELRQSNWKPRHDNAAPKTIAQIHQDAAKAKVQAEMDRQTRMYMGGPMSRGGSRRGQQREQYGPDGFITVGNQPAAPAHQAKAGNLAGFGKGIERSGAKGPLAGGPQSVFARKNQKSDDGSNPPSRTASSQNIFSLLSSNPEGSDQAQADDPSAGGRPKLFLAKRTKPLPGSDDAGAAGAADDAKEGESKAGDAGQADGEGENEDDEAQADEDLSDEEAKRRIDNDIKEFLEIRNVEEGKFAMESLPSSRRSAFIDKIVETVLNRKEEDVKLVGDLFATSRDAQLIDDDVVHEGVKGHVEFLDDIAIDVPSAYGFMSILLVSSGLSREKIAALAETIQGEGVKPPKERLMAKVDEQL